MNTTMNTSYAKHADMIQLLSEHNDSSIPTLKRCLEESSQKLLEISYDKIFSLEEKFNHALLFMYENEIHQKIKELFDFLKKEEKEKGSFFLLIATPNSAISLNTYKYLIEQGLNKRELACITTETSPEDENKIFESAKNGECIMLISDAYRLYSKLHFQNLPMKYAGIIIFDPEIMTSLQLMYIFETMDWSKKPKDLDFAISINFLISTINARESKFLRSEAKELHESWDIQIIINNFFEAIQRNDCTELNRIINLLQYQTNPSAVWALLESGIKHLIPIFHLWYLNRKVLPMEY